MANETLKRYLVERLLQLDPTLSDTPGSLMYQKVIDPLVERLGVDPLSIDIEAFIIDRLKNDPLTKELDIESAGSFLKDAFARPLALLLEPLQREIQFIRSQQSLANADALAKEEVDAIIANMFTYRKFGSVATGTVRVFYSTPQTVSVDASIVFYTAKGLQFIPDEPQTKTEADFVKSGDLYYVEIDVQSLVPHIGANVDADTIKFVQGLPNVVKVTNPAKMQDGSTEEGNTDFVRRTEESITERSLNTRRGIRTSLFDNYEDLVSADTVGYRSPNMNRDIIKGTVTVEDTNLIGPATHTGTVVAGVQIVQADEAITTWNGAHTLPFTNILHINCTDNATFLTKYAATKNSKFVRIFNTADDFEFAFINRVRGIKAVEAADVNGNKIATDNVGAVQLRLVLDDFEVLFHENDTATTTPNDNSEGEQGYDFRLKNSSGNWKGMPLHFTDVITLGGSNPLASYNAIPGRDFLILRGHADTYTQYLLRAFPIRQKLSDSKVRVKRIGHTMYDKTKITFPLTFGTEQSKQIGEQGIEVVNYGCPKLGNPATEAAAMFDGKATVAEGKTQQGGIALYVDKAQRNTSAGVWLRIAADASRPNGWESLGIQAGHFIGIGGYNGDTTAYTGGEKFDWWQWGRVVSVGPTAVAGGDKHFINVTGIYVEGLRGIYGSAFLSFDSAADHDPFSGAPQYDGFPDASPYRLHWTVYKNEREIYLPNSNLHTVYDEFSYLPCYDTSGDTSGQWNELAKYFPWSSQGTISDDVQQLGSDVHMYRFGTGITATGNGDAAPLSNSTNWAIVRLPKDIASIVTDDNKSILLKNPAAAAVHLHADLDTLNKFNNKDTILTKPTHVIPTINPFHLAQYVWTDVGGTPTYAHKGTPNQSGNRGFTLRSGIGSASKDIVQIFDAAAATVSDPKLTISDIPGSYPFTDTFGDPVTVSNDKVHVGGMTDVYVKGSAVDADSVSIAALTDKITEDATHDVIHSSVTGTIASANDNEIQDLTINSEFTAAAARGLQGYALHITKAAADTSLEGKVFRILEVDHTNSTIRIPGNFGNAGAVYDVEFRIYQSVRTDLVTPKNIQEQSTGIYYLANSAVLLKDAAFVFDQTLTATTYIELTSGLNQGEYKILSATSNSITIDKTLVGPETNLSYRIYTKASGVNLPLVRVRNVEIGSTVGEGIAIPYKHPVDALGESFSGLNNDPVVQGTMTLRPAGNYASPAHAVTNETTATLYYATDTSVDWAAKGIIKYDVVRIHRTTANEDTYFWVKEVKSTGGLQVLVLDRDLSTATTETDLTVTVGKPSLGDIKLFFLEPTYIDLNPSTEWKNADGSVLFRPSPAEKATVFVSEAFSTDIVSTTPSGGTATFESVSGDFHKYGALIGDEVEIITKVLVSSTILTATAADMSAINNKALLLTIDGTQYSVTFKSTSTLTMDNVVDQFNTALGHLVRAKKVASAGDFVLKLYSHKAVVIKDSSSGVLSTLGLSVDQDNKYAATTVIAEVTSVAYDSVTPKAQLHVKDKTGTMAGTPEIFIKIHRPYHQIIFPADMVKETNGLYSATITASTKTALTTEKIAEDTQLTTTGHTSYGYELLVDNDNYSYSEAEQLDIKCTPLVLPSYGANSAEAYVVPLADITVNYDRSQLTENIQSFLLSDFERVLNNNPLARHYFPAYLYLVAQVTGGKTAEDLKADIKNYVANMFPNKTLTSSKVEQQLYAGGVTEVSHPTDITFLVHAKDRTIVIKRSPDSVTLDAWEHIMDDDTGIIINQS